MSLSIGLMTYVGTEMGRRRHQVSKRYVWVAIIVFMLFSVIFSGLLYIIREVWASFYSSDPNTKAVMFDALPYFLIGCMIIDGLQGTMSGGLKGIDKKGLVTNVTLFAYYVIGNKSISIYLGAPLELYFTMGWGLNYEVRGIWIAFTITNSLVLVIFVWAMA